METAAHTTKILIIDDNPRLLESYDQFFSDAGLTVLLADNGHDGLAKAKEDHPSLILLDLMLPQMNGLEVLQQLKQDDATKDIPVVVLTALLHGAEEKASLHAGAVAYIEKVETEPDQLLTKIRKILQDTSEPNRDK